MNLDVIQHLYTKFEQAKRTTHGIECWSARELQVHLGYSEWRNFLKVLEKARTACTNSGGLTDDHLVDLNKMVDLGSGAQRPLAGQRAIVSRVDSLMSTLTNSRTK